MSNFARKKITNQDTVCDDDDKATPTRRNGHYIIANGSMPSSPTPFSLPDMPRDELDSPEFCRTYSYDEVLFDIRKVNPEKIAAQITLLDLPLFKAIQMEEFRECGWTKKEKLTLAPNIVAFTKKFNQTSFWVVQEILKEPKPRVRSEVIMQFIRIAKKLLDLNNLHSLKAVVSALQSTAIFRLTQTWKCVHKKEKASYDKLQEFISEADNWKQLRDHVDAARLPCIPHLGIYLTDLSYLHSLPSRSSSKNSTRQMETILNMIAYCQNSCYDELAPETHIQKYLQHTRYIDELLKFFEDEQYKLSLKCEPDLVQLRNNSPCTSGRPSSTLRTSKSHEDLLTPFSSGTRDSRPHSPAGPSPWTPQPHHRALALRHTLGDMDSNDVQHESVRLSAILNDDDLPGDIQITVYNESPESEVKGRSHTLPRGGMFPDEWSSRDPFQPPSSSSSSATSSKSNVRGSEGAGTPVKEFVTQPPPSAPPVFGRKSNDSPSQWQRHHRKSFSVGTNVLAVLGIGKGAKQSTASSSNAGSPDMTHQQTTINLIDDSVLDTTFTTTGTSFSGTPTGSLGNLSSSCSSVSMEGVGLEEEEEEGEHLMITLVDLSSPIKEGFLKRKVIRRQNKAVSSLARRKVKYWVQLTESSLILSTSNPNTKKSGKVKVKKMPLRECRVKYRDPTDKMSDKAFVVVDGLGNHSKFSAKIPSLAQVWVDKIRLVISQEEERLKREVETSLIKL